MPANEEEIWLGSCALERNTPQKRASKKKGNCQPGPGYCPSQAMSNAEELAPDPKNEDHAQQ